MVSENVNSGVQSVEVAEDRAGQRLDNFLARHLPGVPRSLRYRIIRTGQVRVNGSRARPGTRLSPGDLVRIPPVRRTAPEPPAVPAAVLEQVRRSVIHEDARLLVLNKPAGLAVHAGSGIRWGIIDAVRQLYPGEGVELVHRLDRETSGCLLLARDATSLRLLHAQFREQETVKRYLCLMDGRLAEDKVVVHAALEKSARGGERYMATGAGGKPASTEFRLLESHRGCSYVEALPRTGRTHQIRAHAAHLGLPLAGDSRYADQAHLARWRARGLNRLFLHAHALRIRDAAGTSIDFSCPLPDELAQVLDEL